MDVSCDTVTQYIASCVEAVSEGRISESMVPSNELSMDLQILFRSQFFRERAKYLESVVARLYALSTAMESMLDVSSFEVAKVANDNLEKMNGQEGIPGEFFKKYGL